MGKIAEKEAVQAHALTPAGKADAVLAKLFKNAGEATKLYMSFVG